MEISDSTAKFMRRMDRACKESYFSCRGITSTVLNAEKECLGHITMLDVENATFKQVKEQCVNNYDCYFILRSSRNNYHIINPLIRSFKDTYEHMSEIEIEDNNHTHIGYKRGDWVLRITDKPNKPIPHIVDQEGYMNKNKTYSKPHLKFLEVYHDSILAKNMLNNVTKGKTLRTVKYWTFK